MRPERIGTASAARPLLVLSAAAVVAIALFMTVGAKGSWSFILPFRGMKVATMALVGYAIAVSTVLFQTVTANRILTPGIMGFNFLYILIQTLLVFFVGSAGMNALSPGLLFILNVGAMVVFGGLLYRWLFSPGRRGLHLVLLSGIVFGILFRSVASFLGRLIDPDELLFLQDRTFASFNKADPQLLAIAALLTIGVSVVAWRMRHTLDVLVLGRETAIGLGVDHDRTVSIVLVMVTVLVSVATGLVGPVTFFGLLVANLAYMLVPDHRHSATMPAAILLSIVCLVGGQMVLERVFVFDTALAIITEFLGGIVFIAMLVVRGTR